MSVDLEIISGPLKVYVAPAVEAMTAVGSSPAGNWVLLGTSGDLNYTEEGVTIRGEHSTEVWRSLGSPYPRKSFRPEADTFVDVVVADMSLTHLRVAFNNNVVVADSGFDYLSMDQGLEPTEHSLMVRGTGNSPLFSGSNMQYEIEKCVQIGNTEMVFVKGEPVGVQFTFQLIYNESGSFPVGRIVEADA
ncbi:MAG TPA: hypothetical protein ENH89_13550 [Aurantimonas coralicida]|uniref:Uncharacterized protein n=2 Tax=root TaxID=1 RepID=A0A9C9NHD7_9HYPH|nr:hypothetical protein [Aurantimonas coralicida]